MTDPIMDKVLLYRNLLAAEDHVDELIHVVESKDEYNNLQTLRRNIVELRDMVDLEEKNKKYHCLTKHLAVAYEAAREVAKATDREEDVVVASMVYALLRASLTKLTGRKIAICGRCEAQEGPSESGDDNGTEERE